MNVTHEAVRLRTWGYEPEGIAHELGIKKQSVYRALQRAGIKTRTPRPWSEAEVALLEREIGHRGYAQRVAALTGRGVWAVFSKAHDLGLTTAEIRRAKVRSKGKP